MGDVEDVVMEGGWQDAEGSAELKYEERGRDWVGEKRGMMSGPSLGE
jgi:hypothetical protein